MTISKQKNGKWLCELYPNGREGRRIRRQFNTKGEAEAFELYTKTESADKPWLGRRSQEAKRDNPTLAQFTRAGVSRQ